jgi:hypothetical protein
MIRILQALGRSVLDIFHPKMLLLLFLPPLASLFLWSVLGYVFWDRLLVFSHFFGEKFLFIQDIPPWMMEWFSVTPSSVATALAGILALLLIMPLAILTSMLLTSVLAMPVVLKFVSSKYPDIAKKGQGALVASTKNLIVSSFVYLVLWVLSLPFWMIPGLGVALPLLLNGYLNYRLFAFDSLVEHASPGELKILLGHKRIDFLILGVVISSLVLIPPLFLILPIYSALCFSRYALLELQSLRRS